VLLEGALHARAAGEVLLATNARATRLVPALADTVQHGVGGLVHGRAAVEHRTLVVVGEQQLEARVDAEVPERVVGVGVVASDGTRCPDLVDQPVLVVPDCAGDARRLGIVRRQLRRTATWRRSETSEPGLVQQPTHRHWLRAVAASAVCHSWSGHDSQDNTAASGW
jgi:hypothetical protein